MKRLISILLVCFFIFGYSNAESLATPTDLEEYMEFEDDDWGYIDIELEREVYLVIEKEPEYFGDPVTLIAVLVNFKKDDVYRFEWEYNDGNGEDNWHVIENETQQTYTFTIDKNNYLYAWRVKVIL